MSDLEAPYLVQDVIESDEVEGPKPSPNKSLSIAEVDRKFDGYSKSASDCICKTHRLALELNHGTVCAAHLILAMTLIPNASKQFELRKVDINKAFRAAMTALIEMERGAANGHAARSSSEELNNIINLAREFASNRDNQEVSVDDLLTALDRLPPESSAAQLIRGGHRNGLGYELRELLEQVATALGQQIHDLTRIIQFSTLEATVNREVGEIRSQLQARDAALERYLMSEFDELKSRLQSIQARAPQAGLDPDPVDLPPANGGRGSSEPGWLGGIFGNGKVEHR